jgi:hypothetical protein
MVTIVSLDSMAIRVLFYPDAQSRNHIEKEASTKY